MRLVSFSFFWTTIFGNEMKGIHFCISWVLHRVLLGFFTPGSHTYRPIGNYWTEVEINLKVGEWHNIKVSRYISQLRALKAL